MLMMGRYVPPRCDGHFRARQGRGAMPAMLDPGDLTAPERLVLFDAAAHLDVRRVCEFGEMSTVLSHEEARSTYDRIGSLQDTQAFYEDRAIGWLRSHADFQSAKTLFEFGCGTGRFALHLFTEALSPDACYRGVDVSPKMISLARARLAPYSSRAEILLTDGDPPIDEPTGFYDRFVSNYVFDLLSEADIRDTLHEARRMLRPGGLLCLTGLSTGIGTLSRTVERIWTWVQVHRPSAVGGCRPIDVLPLLSAPSWQVRHHTKLVRFGITSESLIAQRG